MEDHKQIAVGGKRKAAEGDNENDGAKRLYIMSPSAGALRLWPHQRIRNGELCDRIEALTIEDAESAVSAAFHELSQVPAASTIGKLCKGLQSLMKFHYQEKCKNIWYFFAYLFAGQPLAHFEAPHLTQPSTSPYDEIDRIFMTAWRWNFNLWIWSEFTRAEFRCLLDALVPFGLSMRIFENNNWRNNWLFYAPESCPPLAWEICEYPNRYGLNGSTIAKAKLPVMIWRNDLKSTLLLLPHLTQEDWMNQEQVQKPIAKYAVLTFDRESFRLFVDAAISPDGLHLRLFDGFMESSLSMYLSEKEDLSRKVTILDILGRKYDEFQAHYRLLAADLLILFRCNQTSIMTMPHELLNMIGAYTFGAPVWRIIYTELLSFGIAASKYFILARDLSSLFDHNSSASIFIPHAVINLIGHYAFDPAVWRIIYANLLSLALK